MYNVISIDLEGLNLFSPNFSNEDSLNLETDDVESKEAVRRLGFFQSNLLLKNDLIPEAAATLLRSQVDFLYNMVSQYPTSNKKCITGLLVHFANKISGGVHEFHPLFQPVFLELKQYDPYSMTYIYETSRSDISYHFIGTKLEPCSSVEEQQWRMD